MVGVLLDAGFWANGTPKGFRLMPDGLALTVSGQPAGLARASLLDAVQRLSACCGLKEAPADWDDLLEKFPVIEEPHALTVVVPHSPAGPDVWVVGGDAAHPAADRWRQRGYRVEGVSVPPQGPGLVVDLNGPDASGTVSGRLPRHPASGSLAGTWH